MTAQLLTSELSGLIQESKRKNADLRSASEKSLGELRGLSYTSESQLAADLRRRPNFVRPFIIACGSRNPKYAGSAIICLQRLIASNGLAPETLREVLDVLRECSLLGLDVQLKILQALPSLLQNYSNRLTGELLASAFEVCFLLLGSKTTVVSSTAAATLQQLVVSVLARPPEGEPTREVPTEDGTVPVRKAAFDGYHLLNDISLMTEGQRPQFLRPASISTDFGLELMESILSNHADIICSHLEEISVLRARLMPLIIRILSERVTFSTTLRAMRLLPMIFGNMLNLLTTECEMVLSLLNHMLDPEAAITWKRVLCMEVFRSIHSEPALVRSMYFHFDEQEGKRNIIGDHLAIMVRLAAEKPSVIGLGQQSSMPSTSVELTDAADEQVALQAEGVAGTIGAAMSLKASNAPGISTQWSAMKVACIEQLDKAEPPNIPPTYIYSLVLTCINGFSEGLTRFLLPFSLPAENKSRRKQRPGKDGDLINGFNESKGDETPVTDQKSKTSKTPSFSRPMLPINPISLETHVLYSQIRTSAMMVDTCWPALLAAYSTFLHATLDSDYYHALIRSFQKFTQVSGILRLSTPRDAFLTTLGKNAVPPAVVAAHALATSPTPSLKRHNHDRRPSGILESEIGNNLSTSDLSDTSRHSLESVNANLHTRNLLCMRALLNLGIALGPILGDAWSIVLETLQQTDIVITNLASQRRQSRSGQTTPTSLTESGSSGGLGNEIAAVKVAAARLLESCSELPNEAFLDVLSSFRSLLRDLQHETGREDVQSALGSLYSTSGVAVKEHGPDLNARANGFVVENINKLVEYNIPRLLDTEQGKTGWTLIHNIFIDVMSRQGFDPDLRLKAAEAMGNLITATANPEISLEDRDEIREWGLIALKRQVQSLYHASAEDKSSRGCEVEIHRLSLEVLRAALEKYGDSLSLGWQHVLTIISSIFEKPRYRQREMAQEDVFSGYAEIRSSKLIRSSFGSLELICSDFLGSIPQSCFQSLLDTIYLFCSQQQDFNISLTSTTLFWNISDHQEQNEPTFQLEQSMDDSVSTDLQTMEVDDGCSEVLAARLRSHLLHCLVATTTDPRLEIRQGALHIISRILDTNGGKLRPVDWSICQKTVILPILSNNLKLYQLAMATATGKSSTDYSGCKQTVKGILDIIAGLFENYYRAMASDSDFDNTWHDMVEGLQGLLDLQSLDLSTAVFGALSRILSEFIKAKDRCNTSTEKVWNLWRKGNPAHHTDGPNSTGNDNQPALLAYLQCLHDLYRLKVDTIDLDEIKIIFEVLRNCAINSSPMSYCGDTDVLTPLQVKFLGSIEMIGTEIQGVPSELIKCISFFVTLAYNNQTAKDLSRKGPTYVALSKSAMDLLKNCVTKHLPDEDIHQSSALTTAISALTVPIQLKYKWQLQGKDPVTWHKATTTAVSILNDAIPVVLEMQMKDTDRSPFWRNVLDLCKAIMSADAFFCDIDSPVDSDQDFDIMAFSELRKLLTPALGSSLVTDRLRRSYADSLFQNSIIHQPHPDDLPQKDEDFFECLQSVHIGRVQDLPPSPRSKVSYVLLDELFNLVAVHDSSPERIKLAQAAAPYLILRAGIVLKAYILDQPLRGRMPQPMSQRREMLHVLHKLVELDSEPRAIPDAPGVVSDHKKHLHRVFGLVTKALGVARQDEEMQRTLTEVIEAVGQDFRL
ncbi:MAG: hypothetical protein Q9187_004274 [Circinaria calcarea]